MTLLQGGSAPLAPLGNIRRQPHTQGRKHTHAREEIRTHAHACALVCA